MSCLCVFQQVTTIDHAGSVRYRHVLRLLTTTKILLAYNSWGFTGTHFLQRLSFSQCRKYRGHFLGSGASCRSIQLHTLRQPLFFSLYISIFCCRLGPPKGAFLQQRLQLVRLLKVVLRLCLPHCCTTLCRCQALQRVAGVLSRGVSSRTASDHWPTLC